MKVIYEVYQRQGAVASKPIVTYRGEPSAPPRYKRKHIGKKAKIEAISRFMQYTFADDVSAKEVDAFIKANLFGTAKWKSYHKVFLDVANETELFIDSFVFLYYLEVEMDNHLAVEHDDCRLIHIVNKELANESIPEYRGLVNPIISISIVNR